jgi:hypothetical protein
MTYQELDRSIPYRVDRKGWHEIAVRVVGPYLVEREVETEIDGEFFYDREREEDPDRCIVVMIGDDARHVVEVAELVAIGEDDVCSCGQIGCHSPNNLA